VALSVLDVSGQNIGPIFKDQEVQAENKGNVSAPGFVPMLTGSKKWAPLLP
jgi:hypothetical protein